jgi:hypothetical protein
VIAGKTLQIEGKNVKCPSPPLYLVKAGGVVVDLDQSHYNATCTYDRCVSNDLELWKMDEKGYWILIRRTAYGKEKQHDRKGTAAQTD